MLVLSRNLFQKVMIGKDITISVLDVGKSQVKLGFDAPDSIEIHREEVFKKRELLKNKEKTGNR